MGDVQRTTKSDDYFSKVTRLRRAAYLVGTRVQWGFTKEGIRFELGNTMRHTSTSPRRLAGLFNVRMLVVGVKTSRGGYVYRGKQDEEIKRAKYQNVVNVGARRHTRRTVYFITILIVGIRKLRVNGGLSRPNETSHKASKHNEKGNNLVRRENDFFSNGFRPNVFP